MKHSFLSTTLKGTKNSILLILFLSIVYSRLLVYVPMFIQYAIDGIVMGNTNVIPKFIQQLFYSDTKISQIIILAVLLICLNGIIFIISYIKSKINTKFNLKINRNVKTLVLDHISKLEYMEFSNIDKANVIQRVNNDAATYAEFFNSQITLFLDTFFIVLFAIVQTLQLNITVGLFIILICFLIILLSIWYFKASKPLIEDIVERNKEVIHKTTVSIEESKMFKIFNRKDKEIKEFSQMNAQYKEKDIKLAKLKVWYVIGTHALRNFKEPFILLWGGILVVQGQLTLATISILLTYATKILDYVYKSVDKLKTINEFIVAYKKLSLLLNSTEEVETKPDVNLNGDIQFKEVTIKIKEDTILEHLNFRIKQGENVAIIGDNGAGKTILSKTLIGFYEYTGDVFIGKDNIKDVSKKSIRQYIGLVLQDTYLFTDTVKNNINIHHLVEDKQIVDVCKLADIDNDIKNFEGNIEYLIGKGGNNISGGQQQRIAIARILLAGTDFVVLDDSLSKLDTRTKLTILKNIIEIRKGTIIISHDIEVVKQCDKVLLIQDKTVIVGTHESLLLENKMYQEIVEISQNKILEEEEA